MDKVKFLYLWCRAKITAFWAWYKNLYVGAPVWKKALIGFVSVIVSFLLYLGAVDINFLWLFGKSPGYFSGILNPQTSLLSMKRLLLISSRPLLIPRTSVSTAISVLTPLVSLAPSRMLPCAMRAEALLPLPSSWPRICSVSVLTILQDFWVRFLVCAS